MESPLLQRMIHVDNLVKKVRLTKADEHHKVCRIIWAGIGTVAGTKRFLHLQWVDDWALFSFC